jgi:hypothetical protein
MERAPLDNTLEDVAGQIYAECRAGSVVLTHGDLWHGACDNRSMGTRRVIHLGFACPSTRPQYEIAGALPQTTRDRFPCMRQLAPFQNWWRVPANCETKPMQSIPFMNAWMHSPIAATVVCACLSLFGLCMRQIRVTGGRAKHQTHSRSEKAEEVDSTYQEPPFTGDDATGRRRGNQPAPYRNGDGMRAQE